MTPWLWAAQHHSDLNIFGAVIAMVEGGTIYTSQGYKRGERIIEICKKAEQEQMKLYDDAALRRAGGPVNEREGDARVRDAGFMRCYASNTGTKKNLDTFRAHGWRVLLSPTNPTWPDGLHAAIDNGAWSCFQKGVPFQGPAFRRLVEKHGQKADWIVIPDKVAEGSKSLQFSREWMHELSDFPRLLLAVQDGMTPTDVRSFRISFPKQLIGIFLGGSTGWKLRNMYAWGCVAQAIGCYYHVGRVNSAKRIRLALEAGADSVDGTSGTLYSDTVPMLDRAARQPSLLHPQIAEAIEGVQ